MQEMCAESYKTVHTIIYGNMRSIKKEWLTFLPNRNAPSSPNAHGQKRRFNKSSAKDLVLDFDRFSAVELRRIVCSVGTFATVKSHAFLNKLSFNMSMQNNYYVDYSTFKF